LTHRCEPLVQIEYHAVGKFAKEFAASDAAALHNEKSNSACGKSSDAAMHLASSSIAGKSVSVSRQSWQAKQRVGAVPTFATTWSCLQTSHAGDATWKLSSSIVVTVAPQSDSAAFKNLPAV
jgi:hypothetical protein